MRIRDDGTIQSANAPTPMNGPGSDNTLYRAMVIRVLYTDDPKNVTKNSQNPEVTYDVVLLSALSAGQIISNVRLSSTLGGSFNYHERTLRPASKPIDDTRLADQDGDIVFVRFIEGRSGYPIIMALGKGILDQSGSTQALGPREVRQYNGLQTMIDRTGNYSIIQQGGSLDAQNNFNPGSSPITQIQMSVGEVITLSTKSGAKIAINGASSDVTIQVGSTTIDIDGSSGKISLKGDKIDLGSNASDMVVLFNKLKQAYDAHTHMYDDAGNPNVTQPPVVALPTNVGSQTVKVQP